MHCTAFSSCNVCELTSLNVKYPWVKYMSFTSLIFIEALLNIQYSTFFKILPGHLHIVAGGKPGFSGIHSHHLYTT